MNQSILFQIMAILQLSYNIWIWILDDLKKKTQPLKTFNKRFTLNYK